MTLKIKVSGVKLRLSKLANVVKKDPQFTILIILVILMILQQQRTIMTIEDNAYYEPSTIDVRVTNSPSVYVRN